MFDLEDEYVDTNLSVNWRGDGNGDGQECEYGIGNGDGTGCDYDFLSDTDSNYEKVLTTLVVVMSFMKSEYV